MKSQTYIAKRLVFFLRANVNEYKTINIVGITTNVQ
jgi:hypothetical protein